MVRVPCLKGVVRVPCLKGVVRAGCGEGSMVRVLVVVRVLP